MATENSRVYFQDSYGTSSSNVKAYKTKYTAMNEAAATFGKELFKNAGQLIKEPNYLHTITEAAKLSTEGKTKYEIEEIERLNESYENLEHMLLNEQATEGELSPIVINAFGIQERALICPHLTRAVKTVVAKKDKFKLTERIPYLVDLNGNQMNFIDCFVPDANGNSVNIKIEDSVTDGFAVPSDNINLYLANGTSTDPDYRQAVDPGHKFASNSQLISVTVQHSPAEAGKTWTWKSSATATDEPIITFAPDALRSPAAEDGTFRARVYWNEYDSADNYKLYRRTSMISGQFYLPEGKLIAISATGGCVTYVKFKMVLSPETHKNALGVGYRMRHTPVEIPIGAHFEFEMSEEFKESAEKYYNQDAMAVMTDLMGKGIEQVKDIDVLAKYQEFANGAIVKTVFNCKPDSAFAQGPEEYIRREFCPFMERVAIVLKNKVRVPDCHFRVLGNPVDIRIPASAGVEYIYKRNEEFAGELCLDYEFSVTSDVHKIFYLSSERVPVGKIFMFLIPNSIEDGIITFNHYEYSTYVSNKYRSSKNSNLPTVMISNRYLTHSYYPVMASIEVVNNLSIDPNETRPTGQGLEDAIYAKVQYFNS